MRRNSLLDTKGITHHGLSQSALVTFKNFANLAGNKKLNIELKDSTGYTLAHENIPYVLAESTDAAGREAFLYFEKKYFSGLNNERYHAIDDDEYYEVVRDTNRGFRTDPYRIVFDIVRVKVQVYYLKVGRIKPSMNRVVFPHFAIYYVTTTTPSNATFFGYGLGTYINKTTQVPVPEDIQLSPLTLAAAGLAAGQDGGLCLFIYNGLGYVPDLTYINPCIYAFQIATFSDSVYFGMLIDGPANGFGGGSNNVRGLFRYWSDWGASELATLARYASISFDSLNNAVSHGVPYISKNHIHMMSASNSYNDKLLIMGGTLLATNPFDENVELDYSEYTTISTFMNGAFFGTMARKCGSKVAACNGTGNKVVIIGAPSDDASPATMGDYCQLMDMTTASNGTSWGHVPFTSMYQAELQGGCDGNENRMVFQAKIGTVAGLMYTNMATLTNATIFGALNSECTMKDTEALNNPTDTNA